MNKSLNVTFDTIKDRYQSIIDELNLTVDLTEEFEVIKKKLPRSNQ